MCTCEYCGNDFIPRPQVKNPKACKNYQCQKKRQRENEKDWKNRNIDLYDARYYAKQKEERLEWLKQKSAEVFKAISKGFLFFGVKIDENQMSQKLALFFMGLGVREVNKLWIS